MDRELKRKSFHVGVAVLAVPFLLLVPLAWTTAVVALAIAVIVAAYTIRRRGHRPPDAVQPLQEGVARLLDETMRPYELFPWSPILYLVGAWIVAALSAWLRVPLSLAFASYAILGLGDAASALIGKAYGSAPLPWNPRKTVEGSLAGAAAAYPWAVLFATAYHVATATPLTLAIYPVVLAGTLAGMLAESLPGEDNLTIPLASWAAMALAAWPLGLYVV